jgi:hypothetical protein
LREPCLRRHFQRSGLVRLMLKEEKQRRRVSLCKWFTYKSLIEIVKGLRSWPGDLDGTEPRSSIRQLLPSESVIRDIETLHFTRVRDPSSIAASAQIGSVRQVRKQM